MKKLARWCFNHKWVVIGAWVVAIAGFNAVESGVGSAYKDNFKLPHTDSFDAIRLLQRNAPRRSGDTDQLVIAVKSGKVTDPAIRSRVQALLARVAAFPHVGSIESPYTSSTQIAKSGQVAFANVTFAKDSNKI